MQRTTRLVLTLLSLSLIPFLTGCLEIRMETELKKDGSGKGSLELAIVPGVTEIMNRFADVEDMPDTDLTALANLDRDEVKAMAARADVRIKHFKSRVRDGRRTISMDMEFASLRDYSWVLGNVFDEVGGGYGVFAGEEGQLILREAEYDFSDLQAGEKDVPAENPEPVTPSDETLAKYFEMTEVIKNSFQEVKFVNVITVPGDIIESDATRQKGRTCTWTLDFSDIVSDKDNLKPRIVFSSKGLKIEPLPAQEF